MLYNVLLYLRCLAEKGQNKPNNFSIHVVLRSGAEIKQIARLEVCSPFKIHHYMYVWLVWETYAKILLSDPETSLMTPCLLSLRQSASRSHENQQSSQLSRSFQNFLKQLGWSGWSHGNHALYPHNEHLEVCIVKVIAAEFHLQLYTNIFKSRSQA